MQFRNQRAATIGPDLSHRRTIVTEVLRTQAVRDAVRQDVRAKKISRRDALKVARGYAYEVAANYSHAFVVFLSGLLNFQTLASETGNDLPFILALPALTATAHYHKKLAPDLQADLAKAEAAARTREALYCFSHRRGRGRKLSWTSQRVSQP